MVVKKKYHETTAVSLKANKAHKMYNKGIFRNIFDEFLRVWTIHGVGRIFRTNSTKTERFLWSFGFISASLIFSYVTYNIGYIYHYKPLKTVISDLQLPIFKIPFPEVNICNYNRLNWQRYEQAKLTFLLPQHHLPPYEDIFIETLNAYDTLQFGKFENFKNLSTFYTSQQLQELNYINFTLVTQLMSWKCHEIFTECYWMNHPYNCCEIFSARKSQQGVCLGFNTIESEEGKRLLESDPYYPWRTGGIGPNNGLTLRIHVRESLHSPVSSNYKGVVIMLLEPRVWSYVPHDIPTNTRALVTISAYMHFFDDNTRIFPADTRQCVFEDELESLFYKSLLNHKYMYENCQSECQQEHLMKFCNCTIDLFYPPSPYKPCRLSDLPCIYEHDQLLQNFEQVGEHEFVANHESGMNCPCFYNCKSLSYFVDVHVDHGRVAQAPINPNSTDIEMSVFFLWGTLIVYKTSVVYTVLDLMASLGGLAGLCIGLSLVGITELLHFILIDIPRQALASYRARSALIKKRKSLKAKKIIVWEKSLP